MIQSIQILITPEFVDDPEHIRQQVLKVAGEKLAGYRIVRRSLDARQRQVKFQLQIEYTTDPSDVFLKKALPTYREADTAKPILIVGAGPAGYFAALTLLQSGLKPILLERGEDVSARTQTIKGMRRQATVDQDSNYCFGEGGAGTYSDGKLYTRSSGRGDVDSIYQTLVSQGASEDILIDARPHIGSEKLPGIIRNIRNIVLNHGGEILFNAKVVDFLLEDGSITGVALEDGRELRGKAVILATGHSARNIFEKLAERNIQMQPKAFALGVRVEHPQALIDAIQYRQAKRHENLPPASYQLVSQVEGRGVFSFCMCPGGFIVPTATAPGEVVINGMSLSRRNSPFANAGVVVSLGMADLGPDAAQDALSLMRFQQQLEKRAFEMGGSQNLQAPAQCLTDFAAGKLSTVLPVSSYQPGLLSAPVHELFPDFIARRLQKAMVAFGQKMKGFFTAEAIVVAIESRTSSPVKIPRDRDSLMHPQIQNLYPCGEGAGYAGGIVSSAMDGQYVAGKIAARLV